MTTVKKALYIGQSKKGTTSGLRASVIRRLLGDWDFDIIDTSNLLDISGKLSKSMAFRFKKGPLVKRINDKILGSISSNGYDLIWIDKAIWINERTTKLLREKSKKMIHYTPDCAFYENWSVHFKKSIDYYDHLVTTKSFEKDRYPNDKLVYVTQGYDSNLHKPHYSFEEKHREVTFIGLYEKSRMEVIELLVKGGIKVTLGGVGWEKLKNKPNVEYLGKQVMGEEYSRIISSSYFSLGLLSKRFPELHTTRTFEIPACKTALITEENEETAQFFDSEEVIFFTNIRDIPDKIGYFLNNPQRLKALTEKGHQRVLNLECNYTSIIHKVLQMALGDDL